MQENILHLLSAFETFGQNTGIWSLDNDGDNVARMLRDAIGAGERDDDDAMRELHSVLLALAKNIHQIIK